MRIIFLRHAESEANVAGDNSDHPETKLTKLGHIQAKKAAEFIHANNGSGKLFNIKHILSSPFTRAIDTAKYVSKKLKISVEPIDDLREGSNGIIDGVKFDDIKHIPKVGAKLQKIHDEIDKLVNNKVLSIDGRVKKLVNKFEDLNGSETGAQIYRRVDKIVKDYIGKGDILIVSHGGTIKEYICNSFNIDAAYIGRNFASSNGKDITNCHINIINIDGNKKTLEMMMWNKYLM